MDSVTVTINAPVGELKEQVRNRSLWRRLRGVKNDLMAGNKSI